MYKVRIKKACKGGLKRKQEGGVSEEAVEPTSHMGPVDREDANIEVEKGESAFGDIDGDSYAELMFFGGKRHHSGGTPVNVPPGTFIFSDTKDLRIKDKDLLEKFFGIKNPKKKGYTPAEISKQYKDFNKHMEVLKDKDSDDIAVSTSFEMVNSIKTKLGALAIVQESIKGFPDGIPSFAESAVAALGIDPQQLAQQMMPEQQMPPAEGQPQMFIGGQISKYLDKAEKKQIANQAAKKGYQLATYQTGGPAWDTKISPTYKGEGLHSTFWGGKPTQEDLNEGYNDVIDSMVGATYPTKYGSSVIADRATAIDIFNDFLRAYEFGEEGLDIPKDATAEQIFKLKEERLRETLTTFDNIDVPWSPGGWHRSDQDVLQDLSGMLDERLEGINKEQTHAKKLNHASLVHDMYNKMSIIKKYEAANAETAGGRTKAKAEAKVFEEKLEEYPEPYFERKQTMPVGHVGSATVYTPTYFDEWMERTEDPSFLDEERMNTIFDDLYKQSGIRIAGYPSEDSQAEDSQEEEEARIPPEYENSFGYGDFNTYEEFEALVREQARKRRLSQARQQQSTSTGSSGQLREITEEEYNALMGD